MKRSKIRHSENCKAYWGENASHGRKKVDFLEEICINYLSISENAVFYTKKYNFFNNLTFASLGHMYFFHIILNFGICEQWKLEILRNGLDVGCAGWVRGARELRSTCFDYQFIVILYRVFHLDSTPFIP